MASVKISPKGHAKIVFDDAKYIIFDTSESKCKWAVLAFKTSVRVSGQEIVEWKRTVVSMPIHLKSVKNEFKKAFGKECLKSIKSVISKYSEVNKDNVAKVTEEVVEEINK
jgi:hypothetical protein